MITTRRTSQELKILEHLRSVKTHPTAEMVHKEVKKILPTLSLGTVYRNLNKLSERGDILKLEVNGEYRFDGDTSPHIHCICDRCGDITDIEDERITGTVMKKFKSRRFSPTTLHIIFNGYCHKCS